MTETYFCSHEGTPDGERCPVCLNLPQPVRYPPMPRVVAPKPTVPLWLAQAFEQRAKHEPNCSWSREACVCSCGLFELRLHLANEMTDQGVEYLAGARQGDQTPAHLEK